MQREIHLSIQPISFRESPVKSHTQTSSISPCFGKTSPYCQAWSVQIIFLASFPSVLVQCTEACHRSLHETSTVSSSSHGYWLLMKPCDQALRPHSIGRQDQVALGSLVFEASRLQNSIDLASVTHVHYTTAILLPSDVHANFYIHKLPLTGSQEHWQPGTLAEEHRQSGTQAVRNTSNQEPWQPGKLATRNTGSQEHWQPGTLWIIWRMKENTNS